MNTEEKINLPKKPDQNVNVRSTFKINSDLTVKGFSEKTEWVPEIDNSYIFDEKTTLSILAISGTHSVFSLKPLTVKSEFILKVDLTLTF